MVKVKPITTKINYKYLIVLVFASMLVFGLFQINRYIQTGKDEYTEIKQIALTAAAMMHYDDLSRLSANPEDTLKAEYAIVKSQLAEITNVNTYAVFAYIYTIRNGKVLFMADSEPNTSPNYSPAGQELVEATELDKTLMNEGSKPVVEFSKDRWGNWVSILIPLRHPVSKKYIAVFGMDFDARIWKARRHKDLFLALLVVLLSLAAIVLNIRWIRSSQRLEYDFQLLKKAEADLTAAKEKAEESDRLKTTFLKNISHEIRTPMNSILGFAGLLKEQDQSAEYKELYLQNMMNSGQRMLNTIGDIIDLSRIQADLIRPTIVRSNMFEELFCIHDQFSEVAKEKGLAFVCPVSSVEKELFFYTDIEMLKAILQKLIWNALKFTANGFVEIGYRVVGNFIEFLVKDSGLGVDDSQKTFIFEYFRQGNDSMSRNYEGNGLGLSIAKSYVELLGGTIWVESNEDGGSLFKFTIPYHKHQPPVNS